MATPEVQRAQPANDDPAGINVAMPAETAEPGIADDPSNVWWGEFERLEKLFLVFTGILVVGTLAAYLGYWTGSKAIAITGLVVFSLALVGIASLAYPLARIAVRAISDWRRQRSGKRDHQV